MGFEDVRLIKAMKIKTLITKILKIALLIIVILIVVQIVLYIGFSYSEKITLTKNIDHIITYKKRIFLLTPFGDNGIIILQPFPSIFKKIIKHTILINGKKIWYKKYKNDFSMRGKNIYISPNKQYILISDKLESEPYVIIDVKDNKQHTIKAPDGKSYCYRKRNCCGYPFSFHKWSNDSKKIIVYKTGTYVKMNPTRDYMAFREFWGISTKTKKGKLINREEKKWHENIKWD